MEDLQALSRRVLQRAEQLRAQGLSPEEVADRLAEEFPAPDDTED